jgi:hypothetical protein
MDLRASQLCGNYVAKTKPSQAIVFTGDSLLPPTSCVALFCSSLARGRLLWCGCLSEHVLLHHGTKSQSHTFVSILFCICSFLLKQSLALNCFILPLPQTTTTTKSWLVLEVKTIVSLFYIRELTQRMKPCCSCSL